MSLEIEASDILAASPPAWTQAQAQRVALDHFAVTAVARPLVSERDQNFHLSAVDGRQYVLKIANAAEDPGVTDFQTRALARVAELDPELPVPRIYPSRTGDTEVTVSGADGQQHIVRLLGFLPGVPWHQVATGARLRRNLGTALARLGLALRGFFHPAAGHSLLWDIRKAARLRGLLINIQDQGLRRLTTEFLDHFEAEVAPRLAGLRAQVIYNDLNPGNVLVDPAEPERITGIVDFGDIVHAPLIVDVAVAAAYQTFDADDPLEPAAEFVTAYHSIAPLEAAEVDVLFDLIKARLATTVVISYWRGARYPDNRDYILSDTAAASRALERLTQVPGDQARQRFHHAVGMTIPAKLDDASMPELLARRQRRLGAAYELFYRRPLHLVRGEGVWLYDAGGRAYLDVYNNVPHVGHCHPHVVAALTRQIRTLNTHTRYLYENVLELSERLCEKLPGALDVCMFACTGSEANELALRIARAHTGAQGLIVTAHAYHGNTGLLAELSGSDRSHEVPGPHVEQVPPPDGYRGPYRGSGPDVGERYAAEVEAAIERLAARGIRPAALLVDTIFSSAGILTAPAEYLARAAAAVRDAGGLLIADEVQAGFGRTGDHFWGFEAHRVVPDIVTMGKPMGNGHPLSALVTRAEIVADFATGSSYFNTFGGNPVSCAAGLAVLDVLDRERLQDNARELGNWLRRRLRELAGKYDLIGEVRGAGLFTGAELVRDRKSLEPAAEEAALVVNGLRERGVLIGSTGVYDNVLKMRPPMVFSRANAEQLVDALEGALGDL